MEDAFSVPFILSWLPLYYSHFVIAEFSQYKYFMDQVAIMLKSGNKKTFPSHLVFETDMLRYRAKTVLFTPFEGLHGDVRPKGMFFGIFVLNKVSILSFFVLIRVSILSIFFLN